MRRPAKPGGGWAAAADLQLLQNAVHVDFHSGNADRQLARDLLVGAALLDERQDFSLSRRQRRQWPLRVEFPLRSGKPG